MVRQNLGEGRRFPPATMFVPCVFVVGNVTRNEAVALRRRVIPTSPYPLLRIYHYVEQQQHGSRDVSDARLTRGVSEEH